MRFRAFLRHWAEWLEVELVAAHGGLEPDGGGVEQVLLVPLAAQVALVSDQNTVAQLCFQVVEVMDVVCGCTLKYQRSSLCPVGCARRMDLVAKIMRLEHRAIAVIRPLCTHRSSWQIRSCAWRG